MEFIIRLQGEERRRERESGEICLKNETAKEKIYEEEERNKDEKRIWIEYEFKHYRTISDKLRGRKKKKISIRYATMREDRKYFKNFFSVQSSYSNLVRTNERRRIHARGIENMKSERWEKKSPLGIGCVQSVIMLFVSTLERNISHTT